MPRAKIRTDRLTVYVQDCTRACFAKTPNYLGVIRTRAPAGFVKLISIVLKDITVSVMMGTRVTTVMKRHRVIPAKTATVSQRMVNRHASAILVTVVRIVTWIRTNVKPISVWTMRPATTRLETSAVSVEKDLAVGFVRLRTVHVRPLIAWTTGHV